MSFLAPFEANQARLFIRWPPHGQCCNGPTIISRPNVPTRERRRTVGRLICVLEKGKRGSVGIVAKCRGQEVTATYQAENARPVAAGKEYFDDPFSRRRKLPLRLRIAKSLEKAAAKWNKQEPAGCKRSWLELLWINPEAKARFFPPAASL
jgi:hypothetical protein